MPRKPKIKPEKITVVVDGTPIAVALFPPDGSHTSWYVYWQGLPHSRSTGANNLRDATVVAEKMLRNGGGRPLLADGAMSDDEFEAIQRDHFTRKHAPDAMKRAAKSLEVCLEAIDAFRRITGLNPITLATPEDCAKFQRQALELPKSWRLTYPKAKRTGAPKLSPNTVLKWSTALAAAFERANINSGKKCVRSVVPKEKLLTSNPWRQFQWIEGSEKTKRHLLDEELISIIEYFQTKWLGVTAVTAAAKTCLWAWARLSEMASLQWHDLRVVGGEQHFQIIGKWGVEKWARLPSGLMEELRAIKGASDYLFASYTSELRGFYLRTGQPRFAALVSDEFSPSAFAGWFHERIKEWAEQTGHPPATPHAFRKTALQHARQGEDLNRQVAQDAKVSESVMMAHYVTERDEEMRQASNRTYHRILLSLSLEAATHYGYRPDNEVAELERRLAIATGVKDWEAVAKLATELARRNGRTTGDSGNRSPTGGAPEP